ncbi:hypothetical protein ABVT39_011859 [Epinephelus coioides]
MPQSEGKCSHQKCGRGSMRWIREGPLLFVKWMDTQEVSLCSTIRPAFAGETVRRRVKDGGRCWAVRNIPCPTPIMAYNKNMDGVDLSDQLIQYYSTHRKTGHWYRTVLLHFLDITTANAFILHHEMSSAKQVQVQRLNGGAGVSALWHGQDRCSLEQERCSRSCAHCYSHRCWPSVNVPPGGQQEE